VDPSGWPTRRQGSAEFRLVTVGRKPKVGPEFPTLNRPSKHTNPTRGNHCGEQQSPKGRSTQKRSPPRYSRSARRRSNNAGNAPGPPSCTGVGVEKLGRGGQAVAGCHARGLPVSELRRRVPASCPFLREAAQRRSERPRLLRSLRVRRLSSQMGGNSGPYVSGTMGADERNNHAYGIS